MSFLLSYYSGILTDALTIGAIIGALAGVVMFTASSAGEGFHRVVIGFAAGGIIMGIFQAVMIGGAASVGDNSGLNPLFSSDVGSFGALVYRGIVWTIQAAVAGGLLMVISLAPFRAFKGAMAGVIIGTIAAFLAWGALRLINTPVPIVVFYILILGVVLFIIENIPRASR